VFCFKYCGFCFNVSIKGKRIEKITLTDCENCREIKSVEEIKEYFKPEGVYKKLYNLMKEKRLYTYKELAEKLNVHPRKVGKILNKNPFLILIPCHRVVKSNGEIGGYVLGVEIKKKLLDCEGLRIKFKKRTI